MQNPPNDLPEQRQVQVRKHTRPKELGVVHDRIGAEVAQIGRERVRVLEITARLRRDGRREARAALVEEKHTVVLECLLEPARRRRARARRRKARAALEVQQQRQMVVREVLIGDDFTHKDLDGLVVGSVKVVEWHRDAVVAAVDAARELGQRRGMHGRHYENENEG